MVGVKFYPVCVKKVSEKTIFDGSKKKEGYLRFLNSCIPSIVVTYWNPFSMSLVASLAVVAPVQVHSSSFRLSRCIYRWVVVSFV